MADYEDSFETESASLDAEVEAMQANTSTISDSGRAARATAGTSSTANDAVPIASLAAAAASPVAAAPGVRPVVLPVPVPVPVSATDQQPKETVPASKRGDYSSATPSFPPSMPQSGGGVLTPIVMDDALAFTEKSALSNGQADGGTWRHSMARSSDKLSSSESLGLPREIAEAAARAGEGLAFQALSHYVAFGSGRGSVSTTPNNGQQSQRTSELQVPQAPSRARRQVIAFPSSEDGSLMREKRESPMRSPSVSPHGVFLTVESPQKAPSETKSASMAPSSIFSTLSQHLQVSTQQQQPSTTTAADLSSMKLPLAPPFISDAATSTSTLAPAAPVGMVASSRPMASSEARDVLTNASAAVTPGATAAAATMPLPSLPPPGWAAEAVSTPKPTGAFTEATSSEGWMIDAGSARLGSSLLLEKPTQPVAPLPPPLDHYRMNTGEARVSELREASEAVERLVKAFAMLKGYGVLERKDGSERAAAKVSVSAATTTAHRAGAASTVQARPIGRMRDLGVPKVHYDVSATDLNSKPVGSHGGPLSSLSLNTKEREQLAEGLILDCVLGLLQEHATRRGLPGGEAEDTGNDSAGSPWQAARPHYELVSADSFASGVGGSSHRQSALRAPIKSASSALHISQTSAAVTDGVFGIEVPLFDPRDRHSAADLYNVAREALEKYVLRRVRTNDTTSQSTPTTKPLAVTHITAAFAWALLLDMSSVCQEIARCAYDAAASSPSPVYPILVEFKGDAACAEVARSAMHCLPFEVLNTPNRSEASSSSAEARGYLFRMACWVTQEQLLTISDALMDTVREDVVKRARLFQYTFFNTAASSEVDPRLLVPPQTPMLMMRPLPNRKGGGSPAATAASSPSHVGTRYQRIARSTADASATERDLFDVPAAALQKLAYNVSVLSTNILCSSGADSILADVRAEEYGDVAMAVSEAVSELLQDESIKAAVQRRAAEKVKKSQMEKKTYASTTRQRKEQAIIDKAEREAEEMVQHILQEMHAQGVS
ncbi:hypothetical protein ABL78_6271 [Leptomonas seymouri]|uniref:Uncharacterized protein n=1 Tax=Leptomonas seymouri TaxID=5684 RepID=A0A0N0P4C6_LEPSE|nr:hypothetical protein ABL78_6271 [Leptomonas seymouri]|eukprot:KPI84677.1 hypothetical protein ABL78_6271 [Leptomonas seymouri]